MQILFATNNVHKMEEIRAVLGTRYSVLGLKDLDVQDEIPEEHETLEENASQKARYIYEKLGISCFADDTGLEVDALGGAPGVYSARYSRIGEPVYPEMKIAAGNIRKLLEALEGKTAREARFRTVIALFLDGREYRFEGTVHGRITRQPMGDKGFGYDPVFIPEGYNKTFAQMDLALKNSISHRGMAIRKLAEFLGTL